MPYFIVKKCIGDPSFFLMLFSSIVLFLLGLSALNEEKHFTDGAVYMFDKSMS
uniref:Uncharacterized protein n=1 Tax=Thermosporothrix sp. COM3 TaxID=2490863 RepID=A0A455SK72_9CHLR|nr:hypothetical protein KTC_01950 [Thermosporothrix sp. COM3]